MPNRRPSIPVRVLFLIPDFSKGGAERFLIDLCRALQNRPDVEFVIGTLSDGNQYPELTTNLPVIPLQYTPFSFAAPPEYAEYGRLLTDFRPQVVHTHLYLAEFLSAQHVSERIAYVCHGHDNMVQFARPGMKTLFHRQGLTNWLEKRYLIRKKYSHARTSFIANSTHTRRYFQDVLPRFMRDDVHLLRCGFDYGRFRADAIRVPQAGETLRIVNVGSFQEKKNQILIVRIADELRKAGVDFHVDLLGDGALRGTVQEAVDRLGLQQHVSLHGNVDRVEEWLWRSHLYLHTAWYEPFGLVLLEAMAAGLPCVVLDGKGNRDLIEEGRNGFLIERQDPAAFATRIRELAASPTLYQGVATYAQQYARDFDIGPAAERFLAFYRTRLAGMGRHG